MISLAGKWLVLLLCGCHVASHVVADCPYKECPCYLTSISCGLRELTSMPVLVDANATGYLSLNLNSNDITEIPSGSLPVGLRELSLLNNPITTIDDNAFNEVSATLQTLYFINPRLTKIPDAFLKLDSLKILYIINSTILDWNPAAMVHIGDTSEVLKLETVGLTAWPDWLAQFEHLKDLDLANNAISSIPDDAFDTFYNLMTLTLSNNKFTAVPKALSKLTNLTTLNLENNNISNITWLPQSSELTSLSLDNNQISDAEHLSNVLATYADSLHSLALPFNQLKAIPDLSFVTDFWFCDLSNNMISDPNSGHLNNSTSTIDLSYNLLPSIPIIYSDLTSVSMMFLSNNVIQLVQGINIRTWVTHLELQNNLITELNDTSFPENSTLENLILDNNPLETISELTFKNLESLTKLSLQNTKLTRLPLSLVYLTSISYIVLNNNTGLVCTCTERAVDKVADYIDLNGNCGDISIYDFLANLSGSCP